MRSHWSNCIANFDNEVDDFVADYFADPQRRVLLVAAAGFDPRSRRIAALLSGALGDRLSAVYIREERPRPSEELVRRGDENEAALQALTPNCRIVKVDVFADDGAPVGGTRVIAALVDYDVPEDITDVVLDFSALSTGIGFPLAKILLEDCEAATGRAFHLMVVSNPETDDRISSVPSSRPSPVRGFAPLAGGDRKVAQIWIPQLAHGKMGALAQIGVAVGECYKICPLLPFPASNPRRADDLLSEYQSALVDEWLVDPRDVVYASERNPLDCFRTLSMLKIRFDRTMQDSYEPRLVLSPVGSKVLAAGALLAAIEHEMAVHYLETEGYTFEDIAPERAAAPDQTVHLILSGPLYASYPAPHPTA